ncbi:MAG: class I SAM-dependent methyltransferase [Polaromonas sp.]|nr:class I SAM-dependent methyltransferase [Polaromonas sp.]
MSQNASIRFFDEHFQHQIAGQAHTLNPFEVAALPHIRGKVLDYGCGIGNLTVAAARRGCPVFALDGSHAAIEHLRDLATLEGLPIVAEEADLQEHEVADDFDSVVCIGLLMFFDCLTAYRKLQELLSHVRPGGVVILNVLTEGTTYMDMFSPEGHCLFQPEELRQRFTGWHILSLQHQEFPAPSDTRKVFLTIIANKPAALCADV